MRSIDLHWLWKRDKWLPLPDLKIINTNEYQCNCYCRPGSGTWLMPWGEEIWTKNGLIVIGSNSDEYQPDINNIMAHEWRHHYQYHSGWNLSNANQLTDKIYKWDTDWEQSAKLYYSQPHETDALRFEVMMVPTDYTKYKYSLITPK